MKTKQRLFVIIGILIIALASGGVYINSRLERLANALNSAALFTQAASGSSQAGDASGTVTGSGSTSSGTSSGTATAKPGSSTSVSNASAPSAAEVAKGALSKVDRPVSKTDMIKAGLILMQRLSPSEISYLYQVGMQGSHSPQEIEETRRILVNKLSTAELSELEQMGAKYGKNMQFLK